MTTMNGITNELLTNKGRKKWQTRCGAFLLAVVAAWNGAYPGTVQADIRQGVDWFGAVAATPEQDGVSISQLNQGYVILDGGTTVSAANHLSGGTSNSIFDIGISNVMHLTNGAGGVYRFNGFVDFSGGTGTTLTVDPGVQAVFAGNFRCFTHSLTANISNSSVAFSGTSIDLGSNFVANLAHGDLTIGSTTGSGATWSSGTINADGTSKIHINEYNTNGAFGGVLTAFNLNHDDPLNSTNYGVLEYGRNNTIPATYYNTSDLTGNRANIQTNAHTVILDSWAQTSVAQINKLGIGTLILNRDNGGTGEKRILEGTIAFATQGNLGTGDVIFAGTGSNGVPALRLSNASGMAIDPLYPVTINNRIIANAAGNINVVSTSYGSEYDNGIYAPGTGSSTLIINGDGKLSGNGALTKIGMGRLVLNGDNSSYTGTFGIGDGTVIVNTATSFGANDRQYVVAMNSTSSVSTLDFDITGTDTLIHRSFNLTGDKNNIGVSRANKVTLDGTISGMGGFIKSGTGTLAIASGGTLVNTYAGPTVIDNGVLAIDGGSALGSGSTLSLGQRTINATPILETDTTRTPFNKEITLVKDLNVNHASAAIRTVGSDNVTIITGNISHDPGLSSGNLHKTGAGTLRLEGTVASGFNGQMYIGEGTLAVGKNNSLTGIVHFGSNKSDTNSLTLQPFQGASSTLRVYETMSSTTSIYLDRQTGNTIMVDDTKTFTLAGGIHDGADANNAPVVGSFIKAGLGTLVLRPTSPNTFSGTTTIQEGSIVADAKDVIANSSALIMAGNTLFDSSGATYDQKVGDLRSQFTTATVNIGANALTLNTKGASEVFLGNIIGSGKVVKAGGIGTSQSAGFEGFTGSFDIQAGTLLLNTDTYITGLSGNALTYLDVYDKTLTVDIAQNQIYAGSIVSSAVPEGQGRLIKDGLGTLTTRLINPPGSGSRSFEGSIEMRQGNLNVTGDMHMRGDMDNELVYYINDLTGSAYSTIAVTGNAIFDDGSVLNVKVREDGSGSGWNLAAGQHTVGMITGGPGSIYSTFTPEQLQLNLGQGDTILTPSTVNSLFYRVGKLVDQTSTYSNLRVIVDVTGIGGIGETYNQRQVGQNLDGIRTGQTTAGIADIIKQIWTHGSNITVDNRDQRLKDINDMLTRLSGDTMANAMFLGLNNHYWRGAFERLNLDAQMYYAPGYYQQQGYRGQSVANISRVWFNPYTTSMDVKSDGNARSYGTSRQGFIMGYDRRIAQNASAGLLFGYSNPYLYQNDDRVRTGDFQFGAYAGAMIGYYFELKGYMGYGHQEYESTRVFVNPDWSTSPDHRLTADGRFAGDTFAFSLELARPLFFGFCIVRPTIGLDSQHVFRGNFSERGDSIAQSYRNTDYHQTLGRIGFSAETCTFDRLRIRGKMFYTFQMGGNDYAVVNSQFIGIGATTSQTARSIGVGTSYFDAGVGAEYYLNPQRTFAIFGDYDGSTSNQMIMNTVSLGFHYIY